MKKKTFTTEDTEKNMVHTKELISRAPSPSPSPSRGEDEGEGEVSGFTKDRISKRKNCFSLWALWLNIFLIGSDIKRQPK